MQASVDHLEGRSLGNYQLKQLLGRGNLSAVYVAQLPGQQQTVMLTVFILPEECVGRARERFMARFMHESSLLVTLKHPNIVPVYDYGEQYGYPYLVTPLGEVGSLAALLQQQVRCTPTQTLKLLKQIAAALDYAHQNGVVHGSLKPSNIFLSELQGVQLAGFGLTRMLEMRGVGSIKHAYPHFFSIAGTFLPGAEYIAPEVVQGSLADDRSDIYSLGIIIFELLSGHPPFTGNDPLQVALQHVQQRMPTLQSVRPDLPMGLDLVLQRALERNPEQRLHSAAKLAEVFERTLNVLYEAAQPKQISGPLPKIPLRPTSQWLVEETTGNPRSLGIPSFQTTTMPAADSFLRSSARSAASLPSEMLNSSQMSSDQTTQMMTNQPPVSPSQVAPSQLDQNNKQPDFDPFTWLNTGSSIPAASSANRPSNSLNVSTNARMSAMPQPGAMNLPTNARMSAMPAATQQQPGMLNVPMDLPAQAAPASKKKARTAKKPAAKNPTRRRILFATGAAIVVSAVGVGGFSLLQSMQKAPNITPPAQPGAQQKPLPQKTAVPNQKPANTQTTTKNPQPPAIQGIVLANKNMANNSAIDFVNPADKVDSILVHLATGAFVAYEKACTHQGVAVYYDAPTKKLICPRHKAVYDPANNAAVLSGPAPAPLKKVAIHLNADGSVSAG